MSKYTISIKNLMKNGFDFGLLTYPIFDENYRSTLNRNILYYYFEDEIGFETPELFKVYLNRTMERIMPYYNNLYIAQKEQLEVGLINNVSYKETYNRKIDSESNVKDKNLYQDTPQGKIPMTEFDDQEYATNMTTSNNKANGNSNEDYIRTVIGNNGNRYPGDVFNDIKNNFVNIDNLIIDELKDLFMGLY